MCNFKYTGILRVHQKNKHYHKTSLKHHSEKRNTFDNSQNINIK